MFFLGAISGMSGAYSNATAGASGIATFTISPGIRRLYLMPSASGISFEIGLSTGFQTTLARAAQLKFINGDQINGPFQVDPGPSEVATVSIYYGGTGVSVRVYGAA